MFKTKGYKVEQTINTNSYILSLHHIASNKKYIYEIYKSITETKILSNAFFNEGSEGDEGIKGDEDTIIFTAETVKPLSVLL